MKYYIKIALQHYAMGLIIPISIIWKLQNGLSLSAAVLTESAVLLVTALADLPAGFVANRINNRRSLLIGGALHLIGMILLAVGSSFVMFMIAAVFTGLAWAFISGADEAYIHDDFIEQKDEYKKVFATANIVDEVATIIGMLCASLLVYLGGGLRVLFIIASAVLVVHFAYTYLFLQKSQPLPPTNPSKTVGLFKASLFANKGLLVIIPTMLAFTIIYEAARPLWQAHMQQMGIDLAAFGLIFAILKLASLSGSVLARYRHFNTRELAYIFATMLLALLVFGSNAKIISLTALCAYLFTENYFRVYMSTLLNALIKHDRPAILSFGSVIRNAGGALIVAGTGLVVNISIFAALAALVVIKIPAILYILSQQSKVKEAA